VTVEIANEFFHESPRFVLKYSIWSVAAPLCLRWIVDEYPIQSAAIHRTCENSSQIVIHGNIYKSAYSKLLLQMQRLAREVI
jgi:hypothetical protein